MSRAVMCVSMRLTHVLQRAAQPTLLGLGHALRKQCRWDEAEAAYNAALGLVPRSAATTAALAFTAQLRGDNDKAIELYHVALGQRPDDRRGARVRVTSQLRADELFSRTQLCAGDARGGAGGGLCRLLREAARKRSCASAGNA